MSFNRKTDSKALNGSVLEPFREARKTVEVATPSVEWKEYVQQSDYKSEIFLTAFLRRLR